MLTGDFDKLKALTAAMKSLKRDGARRLTKQLAIATEQMVHRCFETSTDINGRRWKPLKYRKGKPLLDTRRLDNSIKATMRGPTSFSVWTSVVYAAVHNFGGTIHRSARTELRRYTSGKRRRRLGLYSKNARSVRTVAEVGAYDITIPKRQFLPEGGKLPMAWERRFRFEARRIMEALFKR